MRNTITKEKYIHLHLKLTHENVYKRNTSTKFSIT